MLWHVVEMQFVGRLAFVFFEVLDHIADVEKRVALEPEVDEGGLHAGKHLRHAAFVDVADDRAMTRSFDGKLDDLTFVEHGDARLVFRRIDHDLARHWRRDYVILSREDGEGPAT